MKRFLFLFLTAVCLLGMAQTRIIPHISKEVGGFKPTIIVSNLHTQDAQEITLIPYLADGTQIESVSKSVEAGNSLSFSVYDLFGREDISHMVIQGSSRIKISISYLYVRGESPSHVHESSDQTEIWKLFPGNSDLTWDGFAVVNTSKEPIGIRVTQKNSDGTVIESRLIIEELTAKAKGLYVFTDFMGTPGAYYEVSGGGPFAITALRGTLPGLEGPNFLFENSPIAGSPVQQPPLILSEWRDYEPDGFWADGAPTNMTQIGLSRRNGDYQEIFYKIFWAGPGDPGVLLRWNSRLTNGDTTRFSGIGVWEELQGVQSTGWIKQLTLRMNSEGWVTFEPDGFGELLECGALSYGTFFTVHMFLPMTWEDYPQLDGAAAP